MNYPFSTTEQVSKYHPDKYADQISDLIVTEAIRQDRTTKAGIEVLAKDKIIVLAGEIKTSADLDYEKLVLKVAKDLNYQVDEIINLIGAQSHQINKAVTGGSVTTAGDQGIMFGYAVNTPSFLPEPFDVSNDIIARLESDVLKNKILKGDAKTQVSTNADGSLSSIVVSACHYDGVTQTDLKNHIIELLPEYEDLLIINPAGEWTLCGPTADCGLTGRKIVCDQYGGFAPVGGGAFSGKDPSKVDRTAAYMARHVAKRLIQIHGGNEATVKVGYGIGIAEPVHLSANVDGVDHTQEVKDNWNFTPDAMFEYLGSFDIDYYKLSAGCHYRGVHHLF